MAGLFLSVRAFSNTHSCACARQSFSNMPAQGAQGAVGHQGNIVQCWPATSCSILFCPNSCHYVSTYVLLHPARASEGTLALHMHSNLVLCCGPSDDDPKGGDRLTCGLRRDVHGSRLLHPEAGHVPEEGKGACSLLQAIDCD